MRLLLDSHAVLWAAGVSSQMGERCRESIRSATSVYYSAATLWELGIKRAKGRLHYPDHMVSDLIANGFVELPITVAHAERAAALPLHHQDPFDRMLVAQAQAELLTLVTTDHQIIAYDVEVLDPRR
ncbi:type II toxin-antitoxin system VapC family toxin [Candidatus Poriferisocius sp.]|uniref:type II toxin-antitoxin system VapC family toxin n=1 Tax=Candidatus Poriferisocius sp. TaxID=3101276 RepID=UPI003B01175D